MPKISCFGVALFAAALLGNDADARSLKDVAGRWCSDTNYVFTVGASVVTSGKINDGPPKAYKVLRFEFKKDDVFMWAYYKNAVALYHFSDFERETMRIVDGRFEVLLRRC